MAYSMGLGTALTLIFVAAKLFGAIDWSWLLVFAPAVVELVLALSFAAVVLWRHTRNESALERLINRRRR